MSATTFLTLFKYYQMLDAVDQQKCDVRELTYLQQLQQANMTMANSEMELQISANMPLTLLDTTTTSTALAVTTTAETVSSTAATLSSVTPGHIIIDNIATSTKFWVACNVLIMVGILAGNALTILAITTCRRLRRLISNMFILSLAVSDFTVGVALPFHIAFYVGLNFGQSENLCLLRFFLIIFSCCVSILTLITIAVDRYIAIVYALHYRRFMTRHVSFVIIALNWTAGATVATVPMFCNRFKTATECEFNQVLPTWYMAGIITPAFVIVWSLMLLIYWRIMREAAKQCEQSRCKREVQSWSSSKKQSRRMPDWKSMQVVIFIMGCFSICWLTYFVVVCMEILSTYNISLMLYKMAFSLAMFNSALNPVIYCWKNTTFRRAYWRLLRCKNPNHSKPNSMDLIVCSADSVHSSPRRHSTLTISVIPIPVAEPVKHNGAIGFNGLNSEEMEEGRVKVKDCRFD
nr:muscarinic acetylcholine receptor C [Bactrocera dorsalis]